MNVNTPVFIVWLALGLGGILLVTIVYDAINRTFKILNSHKHSAEVIDRFTVSHHPLSCSIAVRQAEVSADCCLFQSHEGRSLNGGAISSRRYRLKRLEILL